MGEEGGCYTLDWSLVSEEVFLVFGVTTVTFVLFPGGFHVLQVRCENVHICIFNGFSLVNDSRFMYSRYIVVKGWSKNDEIQLM